MTDDFGSWTFEYNADGLRVYRSNGTTEYKYYYNGDKLTRMVVNGQNITFGYDANGTPQYVLYEGNRYFYLTNLQGDVTAIVSVNGNVVVEYTYDAWGNVLSIEGVRADNLGKLNPLRYRGCVYDEETGLYYLQSRYYDPVIGRFINADVYTSTGQGLLGNNMFAYCNNNPIMFTDPAGEFGWFITANFAIGAVVGAATQITTNFLTGNKNVTGENSMFKGVVGAALGGGVYNVVGLTTGSLIAASAAGAATEAIVNEVGMYLGGKKDVTAQNLASSTANVVTTTATNSLTAVTTGKIASRVIKTNSGWFKPQKFISSFTGKYAQKIWGQTAMQGAMTTAFNITKVHTNRQLER